MRTPRLVSLAEFSQSRTAWITAHYHDKDGLQLCNVCHGRIELLGAYISLHAVEFGVQCAGQGKVMRLAIPYCPRCESKPDTYGCIHEPMFEGSREMPRDPRRCDFCMRPGLPLAETYEAKSFLSGVMPTGEKLVDAGQWGACPDCVRLIEQKNFAALVEVGMQGTLDMHPEIPRTRTNLNLIRAQARLVYAAIFGLDRDTDFRQKPQA